MGRELGRFRLPGVATSVPVARHCVRAVLAGAGCSAGDVLLVVSELVANAVKHTRSGRPGGRVEIRLAQVADGLIGVEVIDEGSPTVPFPCEPVDGKESGRGLDLVDALAGMWGFRRYNWGRTGVWVQLPVETKEETHVR
ncbi:ATP-binding protein [Nonomuraea sp. NPDC050404]|uniref:ATP-binding protein n=1 Tax=Nonomuraea sp. NPDC050404 TaxID=3155783 RepID=UPI0033EFF3B2